MFAGRIIVKSVLRRAAVNSSISRSLLVPSAAIFQNAIVSRESTSCYSRNFMTSRIVSAPPSKPKSLFVGNLPFELDETDVIEILGSSIEG